TGTLWRNPCWEGISCGFWQQHSAFFCQRGDGNGFGLCPGLYHLLHECPEGNEAVSPAGGSRSAAAAYDCLRICNPLFFRRTGTYYQASWGTAFGELRFCGAMARLCYLYPSHRIYADRSFYELY